MGMACLFDVFGSVFCFADGGDGAATAAVVAIAAVLSYSMPLYFNAFIWGVFSQLPIDQFDAVRPQAFTICPTLLARRFCHSN